MWQFYYQFASFLMMSTKWHLQVLKVWNLEWDRMGSPKSRTKVTLDLGQRFRLVENVSLQIDRSEFLLSLKRLLLRYWISSGISDLSWDLSVVQEHIYLQKRTKTLENPSLPFFLSFYTIIIKQRNRLYAVW